MMEDGMRSVRSGLGEKRDDSVLVYVIMGNDFPEAVFTMYKDAAAFVDRKLRANPDLNIRWRSYQFKLDEHAS
jgi:hypothetical protein